MAEDSTLCATSAIARVVTHEQLADMFQVDLRAESHWIAVDEVPGKLNSPGRLLCLHREAVETWLKARK